MARLLIDRLVIADTITGKTTVNFLDGEDVVRTIVMNHGDCEVLDIDLGDSINLMVADDR